MMGNLLSRFAIASVFVTGLILFPPQPEKSFAAGLAQDHTVLYYLLEMQRRTKRTCDGQLLPEAPSLMPSEALRSLARENSLTGRPISAPEGSPIFVAPTFGSTPQQAADNLVARQCRHIMDANFHFIGAFTDQGNWTVVMSATDPNRWPVTQQQEPGHGPGAEPGTTIASPFPVKEGLQSPQQSVPSRNPEQAQRERADQPEAATDAQEGRSPKGEPLAPAAPVPVGEMELDYQGRPVGPLRSFSSTSLAPVERFTPDPPGPGPELSPPQLAFPTANSASQKASAPALQGQGRAGVTPLYDERRQPAAGGLGAFADASSPPHTAPSEPALTSPSGTPPRPGQGWSSPLTAQPPADDPQNRLMPLVPLPPSDSSALRKPATLPVQGASPSGSGAATPAAMLALVNALRAKGTSCAGLSMPPVSSLAQHSVLATAAQAHASDMAARRFFSSTSPEGETLGRRLTNAGYQWSVVAENIAGGSDSLETILHSWLENGKQCQNLMSQQYSQAGVGYAPSGKLWVFTLAAPVQGDAVRIR